MSTMEETKATEAVPTPVEIVQAAAGLAMVCDGAVEQDGMGYNGVDSPTVKSILRCGNPTIRQVRALWNILRKYRKQLEGRGFNYDLLVPPPLPAFVAQAPGAPGAPAAPFVPQKLAVKLLWTDTQYGRRIVVSFPYSPEVIAQIKKLEKRWFDKEGKNSAKIKNAWLIPDDVDALDTLVGHLEEIEPAILIEIAQDLKIHCEAAREGRRQAYAQSRAEDSQLEVPTKLPLRPFQKAGVQWALDHDGRVIIADDMGLGKAQPTDAPVLTPDGWVKIGDIFPGDEVIGSDGKPTLVRGFYPQGPKEIFKVMFSDGSSVECCDDHLWNVRSACMKMRGSSGKVLPLKEIRKKLFDGAGNSRWYIPMVSPVEFTEKSLPVDPYLLGALIGNGSLCKHIVISLSDESAVELVAARLPEGMRLRSRGAYDHSVSEKVGIQKNRVKEAIRALGLDGYSVDRFIPEIYKFASVSQRVSLLNGLMDTDGYSSKDGTAVQFTTVSSKLADDMTFLVESLGGRVLRSSKIPSFTHKGEKRAGQRAYTLSVNLPASVPAFQLPRKLERARLRSGKYLPGRAIVGVESAGIKEAVCISVEAPDGLYVTDRFIVTHNTCQALGFLAIKGKEALPALVFCSSKLRGNWAREVGKFTNFSYQIMTAKSSLKQLRKAGFVANIKPEPGYDITILNYDILETETSATWIKMLYKATDQRELEYAHNNLVLAGIPAIKLLMKAMVKRPGLEIENRLNRAKTAIEALGDEARKKGKHTRSSVNGIAVEEFMKSGWKTLICDELQRIKDSASQRGMAIDTISKGMKYALGLTGTPIMNRPKEAWHQVHCVAPKVFPSFFDYGKRYCNGHQTRFGWDFSGASNLEELDRKLRTTVMIRRMKEQVLKELPPKIRITVPMLLEDSDVYEDDAKDPRKKLALLKKAREEWKAVLAPLSDLERRRYISEHAEDASKVQKISVQMLDEIEEVKQAAVRAKWDPCVEYILELQETQGKIIVFMHHHEFLDRMVAEMEKAGLKTGMIDGRVPPGKVDAIKDAFQEGDTQVLVAGITAASEGLNLTASRTVVFMELHWNPSQHYQAEDRVNRIGQTVQCTMYYLVGLGTIEEELARMIDSKREVVNASLGEGDRTVKEDGIMDSVLEELLK